MKTFAAVVALLPFLASPVVAQDTTAAQKLWEGPQLFCKNCHGKAGEGAMGPDLAGRGLSASQFRQEVRKPWGVMPAFTTEQISDAEIDGLTAWFASMPKVSEPGPWRTPLTADMPRGQQAYVSQGCAQCHGPTFDMPRATFGGRDTDFKTMADLVYNHTTAMPKFEEQRPGSRLRMGNFNPLRLSEAQLKEIYDWARNDLGFRPELRAELVPTTGTTYALNVRNDGEKGKGLTAQGVTIDVVVPAGATVTATTGDGYKGVHMDDKAKANVAEWTVSRIAPKDAKAYTITLSQAPANPADLKAMIRWTKPGPKTGPNNDVVNVAMRPPGAR